MGCNSSKDGQNPSTTGDNAPKDKPEEGNAQQGTVKSEETPSDDKVHTLNGHSTTQDEVQEIEQADGPGVSTLESDESKTKYELSSKKHSEEPNEEGSEDNTTSNNGGGEPDITNNLFSVSQEDERENGDSNSTEQPQQSEGGGETAPDQAPAES